MVNRIWIVKPYGLNKGFGSRFCVDSRIWHETPEEGRGAYHLKRREYKNKSKVISLNIISDNTIHNYNWICGNGVSSFNL